MVNYSLSKLKIHPRSLRGYVANGLRMLVPSLPQIEEKQSGNEYWFCHRVGGRLGLERIEALSMDPCMTGSSGAVPFLHEKRHEALPA